MSAAELTPMMRQYLAIKREVPPGAIVMFRLGDFYEMFGEDAVVASPILGATLTQRNGQPMCGVPYHALNAYLAKLIRAGKTAALCDQVEDPKTAKGLVRREVTRIVTPGTVTEDGLLDETAGHYVAAVSGLGLALLDLSTGEFVVEQLPSQEKLDEAIERDCPAEVLRETDDNRWTFAADAAMDCLTRHFKVASLDGFGLTGLSDVVSAAGALLHYVGVTLHHPLGHVRRVRLRQADDALVLDSGVLRHLQLLPGGEVAREASLLGVLDVTKTPMGARTLRSWIARPLARSADVNARLDAVQAFVDDRASLAALRALLAGVRDLERLIAKVDSGRANPRDLRGLAASLRPIPEIVARLAQMGEPSREDDMRDLRGEMGDVSDMRDERDLRPQVSDASHVAPHAPAISSHAPHVSHATKISSLASHSSSLVPQPAIVDLVDRAIADDPPVLLADGGFVADGYSAELDDVRQIAADGRRWIAEYQAREQQRTGIAKLKVKHVPAFGFLIEIPKASVSMAPADYVRRQTLTVAERYVTPELKEFERKVLGAHDRAVAMEQELYRGILAKIAEKTVEIQGSAAAVGALDAVLSLADRALAAGYVRPEVDDSDVLEIVDGRHPVVEQLPDAEPFVPNGAFLNTTTDQIMLITGPNMAGKSTYIRQVATLAVMAQAGSFVPAARMRLGVIDRVFARIGAGDDLARGRSTFLVEMQETANILNNATPRSLIVLDEIGRGTSTFDGISIAWSVAEYLHGKPQAKAKTLFATHYHELTDLADAFEGVRNYTVKVKEEGGRVVFLRRIVPGVAEKSFGIHVGAMAGLPPEVVARATEVLRGLEANELDVAAPKIVRQPRRRLSDVPGQMTFF